MKVSDLHYEYPQELVATEPRRPSRVLWVEKQTPSEMTLSELLARIPEGDALVINDTKVLKRRVFAGDLEILFLANRGNRLWEVLFPSRKFSVGEVVNLPEGIKMELIQKGRPQVVRVDRDLDEAWFQRAAELPLPPYIQKAREQRHSLPADERWYQTAWAEKPGSFASPTASLHFSADDIRSLKDRGVEIVPITLHIGLGTFLPVQAEDLDQHEMHEEWVEVSAESWRRLLAVRDRGGHVWSLGTTSTRAIESVANGLLPGTEEGGFSGFTRLMIQPGYKWKIVDRLLTNFHQPESTLLALVASFCDLTTVKMCYQWAIERRFRLFSYGDLSVWIK
ncbi:MAG: S-adenosylmethionine:tRNA ribosyltransferase-isomerase [Bdellovibrionaceae bacterium]|nr:S-adenosylmethionine:tRNA ribosyltransferase-isomerase [Pseudobdellovibrionaceae bacterium]